MNWLDDQTIIMGIAFAFIIASAVLASVTGVLLTAAKWIALAIGVVVLIFALACFGVFFVLAAITTGLFKIAETADAMERSHD